MKKYIIIFIVYLIIDIQQIYAQQDGAKIIIGPNIQVSHDGNSTHCEIKFAASPLDPDVLAGGVIRCSPNNDVTNDKYSIAYVSRDGGLTWEGNEFSDVIKTGGGDPLADFGSSGTIYFHSFGGGDPKNPNGNSFYRSEDKGKTWSKALDLGSNAYYGFPRGGDRPQIAVDQSLGKYAGRVYVTFWGNGEKEYGNAGWLYRSDDDCKSFIGPLKITNYASLAMDILIASTGKVFFLFRKMNKNEGKATAGNINMYISDDGGASISAAKNIPYDFSFDPGEERMLTPFFAIDNKSEKFRDRIYCVYTDTTEGKGRIKFTYSSDEGNSWTLPRSVDINCPTDADQSSVGLAVNKFGVLGIRWSDTRGMGNKGYNEYFTVSLDGGETFLKPVKVSSQPSTYLDFNHELVKPFWTRTVDKQRLELTFYRNTISSWVDFGRTGGHYTQFAADAKGVFHDFWTDSRDGEAYQIYTSTIEVAQPGVEKSVGWQEQQRLHQQAEEAERKRKNAVVKKNVSFAPYVALSFGESNYDSVKQELSFSVRIKNVSNKKLLGPIKVAIEEIDITRGRHHIPVLLNAENNKKGVGGSFNFLKTLLPGEISEAKVWKFKIKVPKDTSPGAITKEEREKMIEESMKGNYEYGKQLTVGDTAGLFLKITGSLFE